MYFDRNTLDGLANSDLSSDDRQLANVDADTIRAYDESLTTLPQGVSFIGVSLSLRSETTLSLYFVSDKQLRFICGGKTVETDTVDSYQVARIRGIKSKELGDDFKLSVYTDDSIGDVTYCPLTYCRHMLENGTENPKLQDVVTALYWYWNKADMYFEN